MRKKYVIYALFLIIIALFQMNIVDNIAIFGVKPNLFIIFIVVIGLANGSRTGAIVGVLAGFIQDSFSSTPFGLYAIIGLYIGLLSGMVNRSLFRENIILTLVFTFIYTILYESLVLVMAVSGPLWQIGIGAVVINYLNMLRQVILIEALYNIPFAIVLHILSYKYLTNFEQQSEGLRYRRGF